MRQLHLQRRDVQLIHELDDLPPRRLQRLDLLEDPLLFSVQLLGRMAAEKHLDGRNEGEEIWPCEQLLNDAQALDDRLRVVVDSAHQGSIGRCGIQRRQSARLHETAPNKGREQLLVWLAASFCSRE